MATYDLKKTVEAAAFIRRSPRTLEGWRTTGKGPPFLKVNGGVLYDYNELVTWLEGHRRLSTSDPGPATRQSER